MTQRILRFLADEHPDTPCLVVDLDRVEHNSRALAEALPVARIFYAVKANPAPALIERLASLGANFDVASPGEIDLCLAAGV